MKKWILTSLVLSLFISFSAFTCTEDGSEGIVPENDLYIAADADGLLDSNIDEDAFNKIIDKVVEIYTPIVKGMGGNLDVSRNWENGTVNAYAQRIGTTWRISMFGGLARHKTITPDGFALVVCHEIGHHIGGAPRKGTRWASNEGQSDYWANLKCLRKAFKNDNNKEIVSKMKVPADIKAGCMKQFGEDKPDTYLCQRNAMAGLSTAYLFQALRRQETAPKVSTPDQNKVSRTNDRHPGTQCRLDTYYAGSICLVSENEDVDTNDEEKGVCYRANGKEIGSRPLCWFKPKRIK